MNDMTETPSKKIDVLSFKLTGRVLQVSDLAREFSLMAGQLKSPLTPDIIATIGACSGTHLLKAITPRAEAGQSVLRMQSPDAEKPDELFPSINAPQIPFAKILFRPLEIEGHPPTSVVDAIGQPGRISDSILQTFGTVFGADCLQAAQDAFQAGPTEITELPAGEFPIIFLPSQDGGDIQVTPISPIAAFMGFKEMSSPYFAKRAKDDPPIARGKWTKQSVSSQTQNITGKIGGPRQRFLAQMPTPFARSEAELYRFLCGGAFPTWREPDIDVQVLHYAGLVRALDDVRKPEIRVATDRMARWLIERALEHVKETVAEARALAVELGVAYDPGNIPKPSEILFARHWSQKDRPKAQRALSSPHFSSIQNSILEGEKDR